MMMTQEKMLAVVGIEPGSLTLQSLRGSDCAILIPWRRRGSAFSWGGFVCCLSLGFDFGTLPFDFLKKAHFSTSLWQRGFDFWLSLHFLIYQVAHLMKGCASIHCGFCECRSVLVLKSLFELSSLQHYSKKAAKLAPFSYVTVPLGSSCSFLSTHWFYLVSLICLSRAFLSTYWAVQHCCRNRNSLGK